MRAGCQFPDPVTQAVDLFHQPAGGQKDDVFLIHEINPGFGQRERHGDRLR